MVIHIEEQANFPETRCFLIKFSHWMRYARTEKAENVIKVFYWNACLCTLRNRQNYVYHIIVNNKNIERIHTISIYITCILVWIELQKKNSFANLSICTAKDTFFLNNGLVGRSANFRVWLQYTYWKKNCVQISNNCDSKKVWKSLVSITKRSIKQFHFQFASSFALRRCWN